MKIKSDYVLRQVAATDVVVPIGESALSFDGLLVLNKTGVFLWHLLEKGAQIEDLVNALTSEYEVTQAEALADVTEFLDSLRPTGCLED